MALTEIYVDPSLAADSGTGTVGDPYGDLEYAIEQETFDLTNGTRVNVKAGTDEILAAELGDAMDDTGTSIAWVPAIGKSLIFQGYTAVAGDGGVGGISGGAAVSILNDNTKDYIAFFDLHLHNTGAALIIDCDNSCSFINCEIDNTTAGGVTGDNAITVRDCYFHNIAGTSIAALGGAIEHNIIIDLVSNPTTASAVIIMSSAGSVSRNILSLSSACTADGILCGDGAYVRNNSIYADGAGSCSGLKLQASRVSNIVSNNLIEGFSGASGVGIEISGSSHHALLGGNNSVYDCTTNISGTLVSSKLLAANEELTTSPFTDAANGNFNPVDTGSIKEGSLPETWNN